MIERHVERFAPVLVAIVALLTGGTWLAAHVGPPFQPPGGPQYPQYPQQPQFPQQPQYPQYPPPPPPQPPPPKSNDCGSCADCGDCADCVSGCDVSDCDVSGCGDCDCSGVDCTLARASTRGMGLLVLLLPLALLDAWRRRLVA
jgi:hypothetical protein